MKKLFLLPLLLGLAFVRLSAQTQIGTAHMDLFVGILSDSGGTPIGDGSMYQILVSYNGSTLAAPTPTDFLGGNSNEAILSQGSFDSTTTGVAGAAQISLDVPIYADGTPGAFVTGGDALFIRWYPSLAWNASSPGASAPYGQYGFSDASGTAEDSTWVIPTAGSSMSIFFLTSTAGGSIGDTIGRATSTTSAVPEPATTAALIGVAALALGLVVRGKRGAQV